jgi:O-antigen ligase
MGFILSLIYIAVAILSPAEVFPALAPYHVQIWVGLATIFASIPSIPTFGFLSVPQVRFLGVVILGIVASFVVQGWFGGIAPALNAFLPNAITFLFVLLNFRSPKRIRILAATLLSVTLYLVVKGAIAYRGGDPANPMIFVQGMDDGTWFPRMRAFGFLNDPNDLAQFIISFLPLLWLNWRAKRPPRNFLLVILPAALLITGIFLTHSRGGLIALAVVILFAFKDRLGVTWSAILAGGGFLAATVLNFSGGRDVSLEAGASRIDAWEAGIGMLRSHPLFGVGYNEFYDYYEIAAHNTFVHCAAELGLFGYFFWMALVVFSISDLSHILKGVPAESVTETPEEPPLGFRAFLNQKVQQPKLSVPPPFIGDLQSVSSPDQGDGELKRLANVVRLGFVGYLTAGVFLSRSYAMTLFLLLGTSAAIRMIAIDKGELPILARTSKLFRITAILVVSSLFWVYMAVKIRWL